jgi:hypothetical protein
MCLLFNKEIDAQLFCSICNKKLCNMCNDYHIKSSNINHNETSVSIINNTLSYNMNSYNCHIHYNNKLEYLCLECEELTCSKCCIIDKKHEKHSIIELNNYNNEELVKIINKFKKYEKKYKEYNNELNSINNKEEKINLKIKDLEKDLIYLKNKKEGILIQIQKINNLKNIINEKPYQFLLNINNNFIKKYEKTKMFVFGSNCCGQLGLGGPSTRLIPTENTYFENLNVKEIVCGGYHVFVLLGLLILTNIQKMENFLDLGSMIVGN